MDIEFRTQVFCAHGRALDMPAGEAFAPRAFPAHDMLFGSSLPEREILAIPFLVLSIQVAGRLQEIIQDAAAELTIGIVSGVFFYVEVDGAVDLICVSFFDDLFDHYDLLDDMTCSCRF